MLRELISSGQSQVETGVVTENMLDGYYRVNIGGAVCTARNQSGDSLPVGSVVTITSTTWGRFIVSGAARQAADIPTVIIRG